MRIRLPRLSLLTLLALSMAATNALAQTTAASPPTDYANPQAWACRPGQPGACDVDLSTTVLGRDGRATVERARPDPKAPVDCFYVKTWSENEAIASEAMASGLFLHRDDLPEARSGFVSAPVWQIKATGSAS